MNLEQEILDIKQRNHKVELDKKWETSFFRRFVIALITYVFAALWLRVIYESNLWWKAFIPVAGYLLSTFSLPPIKRWWLGENRY